MEGSLASHQHGHQEEGIAGQLLYREGKIDTEETIETNDDYSLQWWGGHGDLEEPLRCGEEQGLRLILNTSDIYTSELACDNARAAWWEEEGRAYDPKAKK